MLALPNIVEQAYGACGFSAAGTVPFALLDEEREHFAQWLAQGYGADMAYLERSADYRHDLRRLFPAVQSVVVTLTTYRRPPDICQPDGVPRIARFAWSDDYHPILKRNLHRLLEAIRQYDGYEGSGGRAVVDSAPAFERAWAVRAGLGWIGRSAMLIHPRLGSFTLIGLLLLDIPFGEGWPLPVRVEERCGGCQRCMEACPTQAIAAPRMVDARRCLSYQTIERREAVEARFRHALQGRIFGCDRCMEVCPYNRLSQSPLLPSEAGLDAKPERMNLTVEDWRTLTPEVFDALFAASPLQRAGLEKLKSSL